MATADTVTVCSATEFKPGDVVRLRSGPVVVVEIVSKTSFRARPATLLDRARHRVRMWWAPRCQGLLRFWHETFGWHDWRATRVVRYESLRGPFRNITLTCPCGAHETFTEPVP